MKGITEKQLEKLCSLITNLDEVRFYTDEVNSFVFRAGYSPQGDTIQGLKQDISRIEDAIEGLRMLKRFAKIPRVVNLSITNSYSCTVVNFEGFNEKPLFGIEIGYVWRDRITGLCFNKYGIKDPNIDLVKVFARQISVLSQFKLRAERQIQTLKKERNQFNKTNQEILDCATVKSYICSYCGSESQIRITEPLTCPIENCEGGILIEIVEVEYP